MDQVQSYSSAQLNPTMPPSALGQLDASRGHPVLRVTERRAVARQSAYFVLLHHCQWLEVGVRWWLRGAAAQVHGFSKPTFIRSSSLRGTTSIMLISLFRPWRQLLTMFSIHTPLLHNSIFLLDQPEYTNGAVSRILSGVGGVERDVVSCFRYFLWCMICLSYAAVLRLEALLFPNLNFARYMADRPSYASAT